MQQSPGVSIVSPCRNECDDIGRFVHSVLAQQPPPGGIEVIVADGMSDDGTREVLARLCADDQRLRIIDNPGKIVSTGLNAAIKAARGEIIIRMDVHTQYAADYVQQCVAVLRETRADNVGGPWIARGNGYVGRAIAAAFQSPFAVGGARGHDPRYEGPADTVYLGCWPRSLFGEVGFFDEELVRNQDDELNLRLTRLNRRVFQSPRIRSFYRPRSSIAALFRQYVQYGYWKVRVIQKHNTPASLRHLVPAAFVLSLMVLAVGAFTIPLAGYGFGALLVLYVGFLLVASLRTASTAGWNLFPALLPVYPSFHVGYGWGFLCGIVDFVLLRRGPSEGFNVLTRASRARDAGK